MTIELDVPIFDIESLAHGIARPKHFIVKWQRAKVPLIGPGDARRARRAIYTGRTAIRLALMAEATAYGVPVGHALPPAVGFTDGGESPAGSVRTPGEPFPVGETWIVFPDKAEPGELVNVTDENWRRLLGNADASVIIIDCAKVRRRVLDRLESRMRRGC